MILVNFLRWCGRYLLHGFYGMAGIFLSRKGSGVTAEQSLKRSRYMDKALPEDIEDVLEISAILEIREFDVFGLAYRWWFGRSANHEVLESHFARYMFNQIVPLWVRHYSRMVIELRMRGELDRAVLGIDDLPDATPESIRAGVRYTVMVFSALALLVLIAELTVKFSVLPCMFPPCY